jgi:type II secretory pathway pseudopilin PulG
VVVKKFPVALALKIGAVLGVVILLAIIFGPSAYRAHCARRDSRALVVALEVFVLENGDFPKGSYADICALLRGETRNGQNPRKLDYIEASVGEMNAAGEFVDPWGSPYKIATEGKLRVYSFGKNRKDDQGTGDDLGNWQ